MDKKDFKQYDASVSCSFVNAVFGLPYKLGANGPKAYDCSALVLAAIRAIHGLDLPDFSCIDFEVELGKLGYETVSPPDLERGFLGGDVLLTKHADDTWHTRYCLGGDVSVEANAPRVKLRAVLPLPKNTRVLRHS